MISDEQLEKALRYIAETDEPHAMAKMQLMANEQDIKTQKAIAFEEMEGSATEKNAKVCKENNVCKAVREWSTAIFEYQLLENKRKRAFITIEVWRSQNASRRQGNI